MLLFLEVINNIFQMLSSDYCLALFSLILFVEMMLLTVIFPQMCDIMYSNLFNFVFHLFLLKYC